MPGEELVEGFGGRLALARERSGLTQNEVGERIGISYQSVSNWESGNNLPTLDKAIALAQVLNVSCDWLLTGKFCSHVSGRAPDAYADRLFNEEHMYTYIKSYATINNLNQTLRVLPYAREKHTGQLRKGKDLVPFINHPLTVACHALALGLDDDNMVSAALLHDVCEDCGVKCEELPVNEETKEAVRLLTQSWDMDNETDEDKQKYYNNILQNSIAVMVKLLDRCNNISSMVTGFNHDKIVDYIKNTQQWIYPLLDKARTLYPRYSNQIFLVRYHMFSVVESVKRHLEDD